MQIVRPPGVATFHIVNWDMDVYEQHNLQPRHIKSLLCCPPLLPSGCIT